MPPIMRQLETRRIDVLRSRSSVLVYLTSQLSHRFPSLRVACCGRAELLLYSFPFAVDSMFAFIDNVAER